MIDEKALTTTTQEAAPVSVHPSSKKRSIDTRLDSCEPEKSSSLDLRTTKQEGDVDAQGQPILPGKTRKQTVVSNVQFASACWSLFIIGWNDGTTGPLIPRMREEYEIGFTVVSLLFVVSFVGYIVGALVNVWMTHKYGFGTVIVIGAILPVIVFSVQSAAPPFPAFAAVNFLNGLGTALQDAQVNSFVGSLTYHSATKMSIVQSFYGLGGLVAPFVSTPFAQMERWSFHYLITLGFTIVNVISFAFAFRFKTLDVCLADGGEPVKPMAKGSQVSLREVMKTKTVHLLGFFILSYVGICVTLGGWIVTFIIEVRNGGPSSGYIVSGYYGGLTAGRIILLPINKWVGERRVQFVYVALALAFEFILWFVPSLPVDIAMVALLGIVLGPIYPMLFNQAARILPRHIYLGAVGWISSFGQAGSAIIPFITGAISQKYGIKSLHPMLVTMMGLMIGLLWLTPDRPPKETPGVESPEGSQSTSPTARHEP